MARVRRISLDLGNEGLKEESLDTIREAEQMMRDGASESHAIAMNSRTLRLHHEQARSEVHHCVRSRPQAACQVRESRRR